MMFKGMMAGVLFAFVGGIGLVHADGKPTQEKDLQGTWKIQSLEADGDPAPEEIVKTLKWKIKGNTITVVPGEPGFTNYTFQVDGSKKPGHFEMTPTEGPQKGKPQKGIFERDRDLLKLCFSAKERPEKFTSKGDQVLYILKQEKN